MTDEIKETETPETETETETPETPTEKTDKSKELLSALAQKEHFRTKTEALETKVKELEGKLSQPIHTEKSVFADPLQAVKLGKALQDYSEEELGVIMDVAKSTTPEAILEAANKQWVRDAIQSKREKVALEKRALEPDTTLAAPKPYGNVDDAFKAMPKFGELKSPDSEAKLRDVQNKMFQHIEAEERKHRNVPSIGSAE